MKEDTKRLAENQVCTIRDLYAGYSEKRFTQFIRPCMEKPCLGPFVGHNYGRRKPTETSVFEFSYLRMNSSLEKLIKMKVIFILRQGMFR